MTTERIAVRVLVGDHVHRGRRCERGEVIHLRDWQVQWLGARVQRVFASKVSEPRRPESVVTLPPAPDVGSDESGGSDDPDDPDPEPEPDGEPVSPPYSLGLDLAVARPAGGGEEHRQQGAWPNPESPGALTLHPFAEDDAP